jgi:hypothetical protein
MSSINRILIAALALLTASGCLTMNASLPGTLRNDVQPEQTETVGKFETNVNHWFIPCGLGEAPEAEFRKALLQEAKAKGADGVANVKFEAYNGLMDWVIGCLSCNIIASRNFKLSGDLVRIKKPALPGSKPTEAPPAGVQTVDKGEAESDVVTVNY